MFLDMLKHFDSVLCFNCNLCAVITSMAAILGDILKGIEWQDNIAFNIIKLC